MTTVTEIAVFQSSAEYPTMMASMKIGAAKNSPMSQAITPNPTRYRDEHYFSPMADLVSQSRLDVAGLFRFFCFLVLEGAGRSGDLHEDVVFDERPGAAS